MPEVHGAVRLLRTVVHRWLPALRYHAARLVPAGRRRVLAPGQPGLDLGTAVHGQAVEDHTYQEERESGAGGIWVVNSDGTNANLISFDGDFQPTWSPDGSGLALVIKGKGGWQIYVINAEGTGPTRLTKDSTQKSSPSWSQVSIR